MAAEFSRELGDKVFKGKARIARLGYWVGGPGGAGYRRLMISANGKRKHIMKHGEHKSYTTDRVILVPGPPKEVAGIREMFAMAVAGKGCTQIARELNDQGFKNAGRPWANGYDFASLVGSNGCTTQVMSNVADFHGRL